MSNKKALTLLCVSLMSVEFCVRQAASLSQSGVRQAASLSSHVNWLRDAAMGEHRQAGSLSNPGAPFVATLIINEYLADPPAGSAGDANGDGTRDSAQDEFVELVNNGAVALNVGGFTTSDSTSVRFAIPAGKIIPAGESAVVFGGGTPTGPFGNAAANGLVFAVGGGGLSLNNGGDTITVKDNLSATVDSVTYTSVEGNAHQSITRSPDVTGGFVQHSTAAGSGGALFSPGARVNGAPFTTTDPVINSISPDSAVAGVGTVSIVIAGSNFEMGSQARVDGTPVTTSFTSPSELSAEIPSSVTGVAGIHLVTVRNPIMAVSNAVNFTVLGRLGINEYLADPPDGTAGDANGDGTRDSAQDEFIEIVNRTGIAINVSGFTIRDADAQRFVFPSGTTIPANEVAVIFGGGTPTGDFGNATANGLVFTAPLALNNGGDTITLSDASSLVVETLTYGSAEGNANQSINRNPDIIGTTFAPHSTITGSGGRLFSPGTLVNGSPFTAPGPIISHISPAGTIAGSGIVSITVTGQHFESGSEVRVDGTPV